MKAPVAAAAIPDRKMIVAFTGASIALKARMLGVMRGLRIVDSGVLPRVL